MTSFMVYYPCKLSGPSLCVHVKQQEKCGRISGVGNKLKKGPSVQDSDNITLRIVCCRVFIFCCWFVLFTIICQWESQSSESLLPLIESAQQGLSQQEWLLRQGKKYVYFRPIRSLGILLRAKGKMYLVNFRSTDSITMSRWPVTTVPAIRRVWKKATSIRAFKNNLALSCFR